MIGKDLEQNTTTQTAVEVTKSKEPLKPGHKLLLSGPTFLTGFAFEDGSFNELAFHRIVSEYFSLYDTLADRVGVQNLIVLNTVLTIGKDLPNGKEELKNIDLPIGLKLHLRSVYLDGLSFFYHGWPRDAHTQLGQRTYVNPEAWKVTSDSLVPSSLGIGGKVLHRGNAILVAKDVWQGNTVEIDKLRDQGYKVGYLPPADPKKQTYGFMKDHIDGHANLVEKPDGSLVLLVAESYMSQGRGTRQSILAASKAINAELEEITDRDLPALPMNFIQLDNGEVILSGSEAKDLELTLSLILGKDKVFTTKESLEFIPRLAGGSIRCLTNEYYESIFKSGASGD